MTEVIDLQLSYRLYSMVRTISGVIDAGVELVTNADDAYKKKEVPAHPCNIWITVNYQDHSFMVTDNAIGMEGEELVKKMSVVGDYTSTDGVRGYFSRGAKDLISIGNVVYVAIKDGLISKVELTFGAKVIVHRKNEVVTEEERSTYGIPENGVCAKLNLVSSISIPNVASMGDLSSYYSMRRIFTDENVVVNIEVIDSVGRPVISKRVVYDVPAKKPDSPPLIDTTFNLDGWPEECVCHFELWELEEPQELNNSNYRKCGVLVETNNAIHANESFYSDIESIPTFRKVAGRIVCNYLDELMYQFEHSETVNENNLFPVVNPDRSGLNKRHPFVKDLYRQAYRMLKYVLTNEFRKVIKSNELLFDITDILSNIDTHDVNEFLYIPNSITHPYKLTEAKNDERTINYLTKHTSNIVAENDEATYNFDNTDFTADSTETGDMVPLSSKLQINIINDDYFDQMYRHFKLGTVLVVEINYRDPILTQHLEEVLGDEDPTYQIINRCGFVDIVTIVVAECLAEEIMFNNLANMTENELKLMSDSDKAIKRKQIAFSLHPSILQLFTHNEVLENVVSNEVE